MTTALAANGQTLGQPLQFTFKAVGFLDVTQVMPADSAEGVDPDTDITVMFNRPEEKTEFDVIIKEAGAKKIDVIKVVRQLTSLGLKEAKDVAETPNSKVLEAVSKEVANEAKTKLEAAGASVEVK